MAEIPSAVKLSGLARQSDVTLALAVVGILVVMILPLPPILLDVLLAFNITLSLIILLVSMYTVKPLDFSIFPSLLLIVTLFRLALNVASTRLILIHGNEGSGAAGQVIKSFGQFVVGGDYIVGLVVFFILVTINFVVITKGAGRVAEVAARFTLDAMPGKQMSIDADLNAGLINEQEARRRRLSIAQEADFYGSMDGASKFVRGDAIAGIVIIFVNILGGFLIGVIQRNMSLMDAVHNYTILTVGDGLVTQIPALMVSTAAGIVVTRTTSESDLGRDLARQILVHPRAIGLGALILFLFGLVPGLPHLPFLALASVAGWAAHSARKAQRITKVDSERKEEGEKKTKGPEKVESYMTFDILEMEVGYGLIPLVDAEQGGDLLERIRSIRRQFATEMGVIVPSIHIRDNLQLQPSEYSILVKGNGVAKGEVMMDQFLAMNPGNVQEKIKGTPTREPAFGLPAFWIGEAEKERAQILGYTVVDPSTVVATHLTEILRTHAHEIMSRQEVQRLLDHLSQTYPKVVEELIPNLLSLGQVQRVLQNLLREGVPIKDLLTILETLGDFAPITRDLDILTEYVRQRLSRTITRLYQAPDGSISFISLDPRLEEKLSSFIRHTEQGSFLALEPTLSQRFIAHLREAVEKRQASAQLPILLCPPLLRGHVKRLVERLIPKLAVLSPQEILPQVKVQAIAEVSIRDAN